MLILLWKSDPKVTTNLDKHSLFQHHTDNGDDDNETPSNLKLACDKATASTFSKLLSLSITFSIVTVLLHNVSC
jgi:hypothetical protein